MQNKETLVTLKDLQEKMSKLTEMEKTYFQIMWAKSGVLYLSSKPGIAKSAISRSIAEKMGFEYRDIRLSMVDETDVGLYPNISTVQVDDKPVKCLDFVIPRWALESNKKPTLIHFEELNRASLPVRNAALQILLERQIGTDFRFNSNVLMMSSGNLGDDDSTDVEEFDAALNNRLIHFNHTLGFQDWIDNFAKKNVHRTIVSFIENYPENLYKVSPAESRTKAYATPRSWTFLSDFIIQNFGKDCEVKDFLPVVQKVAASYIGLSAQKFVSYCEEMLRISIQDVLNNFPKIEKDLERYNRDKKSELIHALKELDINKFTENQIDNVTKFLKKVSEDELTAYLLYVIDNVTDVSSPKIKKFMQAFRGNLETIKRINKPIDETKK